MAMASWPWVKIIGIELRWTRLNEGDDGEFIVRERGKFLLTICETSEIQASAHSAYAMSYRISAIQVTRFC